MGSRSLDSILFGSGKTLNSQTSPSTFNMLNYINGQNLWTSSGSILEQKTTYKDKVLKLGTGALIGTNTGSILAGSNNNMNGGAWSLTIGSNNTMNNTCSLILGKNNTIHHSCSLALGEYNNTGLANSLALGSYNKTTGDDSEAILTIGNGSAESRSNCFSVTKNGDMKVAGDVSIDNGLTVEQETCLYGDLEVRGTVTGSMKVQGAVITQYNDNTYYGGQWRYYRLEEPLEFSISGGTQNSAELNLNSFQPDDNSWLALHIAYIGDAQDSFSETLLWLPVTLMTVATNPSGYAKYVLDGGFFIVLLRFVKNDKYKWHITPTFYPSSINEEDTVDINATCRIIGAYEYRLPSRY